MTGDAWASSSSALAPALYSFLNENIEHFNNPTGFGTLLLLYSCILSRGIENCKADMDDGFVGEVRTLCDRHNYLSQEGVNLLLHGRAVSNVFDGDKVLQDDVQGSTVSITLDLGKHFTVLYLLSHFVPFRMPYASVEFTNVDR